MKKEQVIKISKWALRHFICFWTITFFGLLLIDISLKVCLRFHFFSIALAITVIEILLLRTLLYKMEYNKTKKYYTYQHVTLVREKILFYSIVWVMTGVFFLVGLYLAKINPFSHFATQGYVQLVEANVIIRSLFLAFYLHIVLFFQHLIKRFCQKGNDSLYTKSNQGYYGVCIGTTILPVWVYVFYYFNMTGVDMHKKLFRSESGIKRAKNNISTIPLFIERYSCLGK